MLYHTKFNTKNLFWAPGAQIMLCGGGGPSGPSPADIAAEDQAAAARAQSESNLMTEQQNIEKQRANDAAVQSAANQANASSLLAQENQKLISGVAANETNNKTTGTTTNPAVTGNLLTAQTATPAAKASSSGGGVGA